MNDLRKTFSCLLLLLLASVTSSYAQSTKVYSGTITDVDSNEPIIGVNIILKGAARGTITDTEGEFSIDAPIGSTLVLSYIGYVTKEIKLANNPVINIAMQEDQQQLNEVVVIGYGTMKKSNVTGAIASVSYKQFKDQPVKQISDILQGRTSGVAVTNVSGIPGGSVKIRVRGTTSINKSSDPLYVIDGIVASGLDVNPSDIQSIEVLKDASATAIYGSRGANGVVLVTTKKGKEGKVQVFASVDVGISNIVKKYDLLDAYDYANALNDYKGSNTVSAENLAQYKDGSKGIDWQNLMLQTGVSQDYKVGVSGGSEKNKYYISANVLDMTAMTITTKYQRAQLRVNLDNKITDWFTLSTKINASRSHSHNGSIDMMSFLNYSPTMDMFEDEDKGIYKKDPYNSVDTNPYGKRVLDKEDSYTYNFNGNMDLKFKIIDGLTFSVQGGLNYANRPTYTFDSSLVESDAVSDMSNTSSTNIFWQNTNNLTYNKSFGDHHLTATAVFEVSGSEVKSLGITGTDLQNEFVGYWNVTNAKTRDASNGYSANSLVSGLARVMYDYKGRYMVTGTFRTDGSSKFQKGNRWGYFPSTALAWDIAKEDFMQDQNIFSQLKLRGSFGIVGNQGISSYSTLGMLATTTHDGWGTDQVHTGYWTGNLSTPDVTWESTYQYNAGFDASVLNGRINFSFEWFRKDTRDLLLQKQAPNYNGGGTFWVNQGEIKNSGVEFTVSANPLSGHCPVQWQTSFNASYVKNEIMDLAGDDFIVGANNTGWGAGPIEIKKVGYPIGSFYLYKWKNFNSEGANLYESQSDGSLTTSPTADDLTVTGQAEPKWTFGWNNTVSWKNWDLNVFFNAALGQDRLNMSRFGLASMVGKYRFISLADAYNNGWDNVENKADALFASHSNSDNKNYGDSDFWLEDASFVKLKNISLSYTFPRQITKIADIKLSVSAQNVYTLTKYTGMDPEVYSSGFYNGVDLGAYPVPRTITFGMKLNF